MTKHTAEKRLFEARKALRDAERDGASNDELDILGESILQCIDDLETSQDAAPDLLAACQDVEDIVDDWRDNPPEPKDVPAWLNSISDCIRAAISSATQE